MATPAIERHDRLDEPSEAAPDDPSTETLSRTLGVPRTTIPDGIDPAIRDLVPWPLAHQHQLVPIRRVGRFLTVAIADPTDDAALRAVEAVTGLEVLPMVAAPSAIRRAIAQIARAA